MENPDEEKKKHVMYTKMLNPDKYRTIDKCVICLDYTTRHKTKPDKNERK